MKLVFLSQCIAIWGIRSLDLLSTPGAVGGKYLIGTCLSRTESVHNACGSSSHKAGPSILVHVHFAENAIKPKWKLTNQLTAWAKRPLFPNYDNQKKKVNGTA